MKLILVACVAALVAACLASPAGDAQAVGAAVGEGVGSRSDVFDAKDVQSVLGHGYGSGFRATDKYLQRYDDKRLKLATETDSRGIEVQSKRTGEAAEAGRLVFASAQGYANRGAVLTSAGTGRK